MADICLATESVMKYQKEETVARKSFLELEKESKPKTCIFCEKTFKNKTKCDLHKKIVHWPTLVSFNICQKKCPNELALRNHIKKHKVISCGECGKRMNGFNYNTHLKSHIQDETEYKCNMCKKYFKWKQSLKRHQRGCKSLRVNDGTMFKCISCPDMFIWKKSLKRHILLKHSINAKQKTPLDKNKSTKYNSKSPEPLDKESTKCSSCLKEFQSVKARAKHEKKKHKLYTPIGQGIFSRTECSKTFVWYKSMKRHLKAEHGK